MTAIGETPRAPLAVVGSQISRDEEMFGAAFDRDVFRRFLVYARPYRRDLIIAVAAVLVFTASQLTIPLIIRYAIDHSMAVDAAAPVPLSWMMAVFALVIGVNYGANRVQDYLVGLTGERIIFDLRRAMYEHLQHVALAFMDRTEVGRMMSRLQGDVSSLQEFIDNSVTAVGDIVLLAGIVVIMLALDWQLGLYTLALVPTLLIVRLVWLPRARRAFR
jgi:ATP-binding cassette subfamily B protein